MLLSLVVLAAVWLMMLVEAQLSNYNERVLRARGAVEPSGDVYRTMRWAYPACFAIMAVEGVLRGPASPQAIVAGLAVFGLAKALKFWAIASLGIRWSYRLLVLPGQPLVTSGPYRYFTHPNYIAVCGEIVAVAVMLAAPIGGLLSLIGFGALMMKRVRIEDRALGRTGERDREIW